MIRTFGYSHPELPRVEVPIGKACGWCFEVFAAEDVGVCIPHVGALPNYVGPPPVDLDEAPKEIFLARDAGPLRECSPIPYHRDCFMRQVVGSVAHQKGACSCTGETEDSNDLTPRQEAVAAVALFKARQGLA